MNPYEQLNISPQATQEEIKKAYHKAAKANHPDKKGGDISKMQDINKAYAILSNPDTRERYDRFGEEEFVNKDNGIITQIIIEIIQSIIKNYPDDIKEYIEGIQRGFSSSYNLEKNKKAGEKAKLIKFKSRILKHPENDIIGGFIEGNIKGLDAQIEAIEREYELRMKAIEFLNTYEFTNIEEVRQVLPNIQYFNKYGSAASNSW